MAESDEVHSGPGQSIGVDRLVQLGQHRHRGRVSLRNRIVDRLGAGRRARDVNARPRRLAHRAVAIGDVDVAVLLEIDAEAMERLAAMAGITLTRDPSAEKRQGQKRALIEATAALGRDEIVGIMGDRLWGGRTVAVEFLGDRARIPESAFRVRKRA